MKSFLNYKKKVNVSFVIFFCLLFSFFYGFSAHSETTINEKITIDGKNSENKDNNGDTNKGGNEDVLIKKGNFSLESKDFEIIDGNEHIEGEPSASSKNARESWKKACNEWKEEMKSNNKENQIISISCGSPKQEKDKNFQFTFSSNGSYKIKTKIK